MRRAVLPIFGALYAVFCLQAAALAGEPPRQSGCPTLTLSTDKEQAAPGEVVTFTATAKAQVPGPSPISYEWATTAGSLEGFGNVVTLDTTGLEGSITVTVLVGNGDAACHRSELVTVVVVPPEPTCRLGVITLCSAFQSNVAELNGECKAILDDVVLRLQQDQVRTIVIDGHSQEGEQSSTALKRAEAARVYLVKAGVDANRIVVRSFDAECSFGEPMGDRRIEVFILSEGRFVHELQKNCPGTQSEP